MNKKLLSFMPDYRILIIGVMLATGCDCCCDCKDEEVSMVTINIIGFMPYSGRVCPIPVSGGSLSIAGGNIIPQRSGGNPNISMEKYYLWVEFETCCDNFKYSSEFQALVTAGLAYFSEKGASKPVKYIIALNTTSPSSIVTFPFPTSSSSPNPSMLLRYYEPCISGSSGCEAPIPCGSVSYRPYFEQLVILPWESGDSAHDDISTTTFLTHVRTDCNPPQGYLCN